MKVAKKILTIIIIFAAIIGIAGFLILPYIIKPVLTEKISAALHRETSIDQIKINPYAPSVTIRGFKLADPGQKMPFVVFNELYINAAVTSSIFRRALILDEIRLDKPYIGVTRKTDGTYNFSDLLPKEETKKKEPSKPFLFSLNNIQITGGNIDFHDMPNKTSHTVRDLQLAIPFASNIDYYMKNYVQPRFSAFVNGHGVAIGGKTKPFLTSRDTSLIIDMKNIDVPYYLQYVPVKMNFKLTGARLDTNIHMNFIMPRDKSPELKLTGHAILRKLSMDDLQGNKILRLPILKVNLAAVEPFKPTIHLAQIAIDAPELVIKRDKSGKINLQNLVETTKKNEPTKPPTTDAKKEAGTEKKKELNLLIDNFLIDKADITFLDEQPRKPVKIQINPLHLNVSKISMSKGAIANLDLSLVMDQKTNITAKGPVGLQPLSADLVLNVKDLAIRPLQPYFTDTIQLDITRGSISTDGKLSMKMDAKNKPGIKYQGELSVAQFASIDEIHTRDFLKFRQLAFNSLEVGYNPIFVKIKEISIRDFFSKIVINKGGTTNIQDIMSPPKKYAGRATPSGPEPSKRVEKAKPSQRPPDIEIGKISFLGGTVDFADYNIRPNYAVTMLNLKGSVTGLSSQEISRARVNLKGNIGRGTPLSIAGTINPLKKDLFADIKISFKDLEMSQMTPYTIKFLGYPIIKGKLNFDVSYLVDKRKLTAENKVFFDQLTFGNKVESPDAIKAPVTLAVSLLTDRNGQINLDIPLSGSLDDPKFKVWPLVWQILVNLITKAVTAPFSLLSSVTGGGEEMSFIEFDYGSAELTEDGQKKISALAKVLYDRPNLKMEIEGYVDPVNDKEGLKKVELDRLMKTQKLKETADKDKPSVPLKEITIAPSEYEKYLTLAYKAAKFSKPRTALIIPKTLPRAEMEKLFYDNIPVTDSDLTQLAANRAQAVREQLLQDSKVEPARIFIVKAPSLEPEKKEKAKDSRVGFKLK
ncbi:MAG: hypothetical protein CVU51_06960 [Deltaproteobacteria bacterium HGW-Deltaproteobacteria-1]|jgi:uncharacterized protein involved in outer membrane biogenesis/flagellar motor protein MotB|nr:MAG: hypothetical protein CVU51_06960 [Deltaproteobacteria bacterium HGW-Deltaproteobacteria-1]